MSSSENDELPDPDEYFDWFAESEELVGFAIEFFEAFGFLPHPDLARLKELLAEVPEPPDEDDRSLELYDRDDNEEEYWNIDRMFEDL